MEKKNYCTFGRGNNCNDTGDNIDDFEGEDCDIEDDEGVLNTGTGAAIIHDETTITEIEDEVRNTCEDIPFAATCLVPSRYAISEEVAKAISINTKTFSTFDQQKQNEISTSLFNELIKLISSGSILHCAIHGSSTTQLTGLKTLRADGTKHPYLDSMFVGGDGSPDPELYLINLLSCIYTVQCYTEAAVKRDVQKGIKNSRPIIVLVHPSGRIISEPSATSRGAVSISSIRDRLAQRVAPEKFEKAIKTNKIPHNKKYTETTLHEGDPALLHFKSTQDQYITALSATEFNAASSQNSTKAVREFALLKMALEILRNDHQSPGGAVNRVISTY